MGGVGQDFGAQVGSGGEEPSEDPDSPTWSETVGCEWAAGRLASGGAGAARSSQVRASGCGGEDGVWPGAGGSREASPARPLGLWGSPSPPLCVLPLRPTPALVLCQASAGGASAGPGSLAACERGSLRVAGGGALVRLLGRQMASVCTRNLSRSYEWEREGPPWFLFQAWRMFFKIDETGVGEPSPVAALNWQGPRSP